MLSVAGAIHRMKLKMKFREVRMGDMNQEGGASAKKRGLSPIIPKLLVQPRSPTSKLEWQNTC